MELILWRHADAADGHPDSARTLTRDGEKQARKVAAWLKPRLPEDCEILVSPARRAQQTAEALGRDFKTSEAVATGAKAADILAAARWPRHPGTVLVVGHQPTLGQVAALLLSGEEEEEEWSMRKGALWWFRTKGGAAALRAVIEPELL